MSELTKLRLFAIGVMVIFAGTVYFIFNSDTSKNFGPKYQLSQRRP